jgi:hypothetical protein
MSENNLQQHFSGYGIQLRRVARNEDGDVLRAASGAIMRVAAIKAHDARPRVRSPTGSCPLTTGTSFGTNHEPRAAGRGHPYAKNQGPTHCRG